ISINGIVFNVDEHAYLTLKSYLDALKLHFAGTEGSEEILGDIEARIAEMLQERMKTKREVVNEEDVAAIMAAMGKPEDMGEAEGAPHASAQQNTYQGNSTYTGTRRVFRNPDDKVLGGVCSGVATYFNIDPLILRLLFVVAFFGFGSGFLLYIILWIIIPAARTPSEKLEMKGERVNVSNIEKTVKENLNDFKGRVNAWGDELKNTDTSKIGNFLSSLANDFIRVFKPLLMFLVKVAAVFLAVIAGFILLFLILSVFGVAGATLPQFVNDVFVDKQEMVIGTIGLAFLVGAPIIALLYYALKLIFNIKYNSKWIGISLIIVWLAGLGMVGIMAGKAIQNFGTGETLVENVELEKPIKDILYLDINRAKALEENSVRYNAPFRGNMRVKINENDIHRVQLDIQRSENGKFELVKEYSAHGKDVNEARENAAKINYSFSRNDTQLTFDEIFNIEKGNKWRAQDVKLILKVPVGQIILMQPGMERIIYDIDNTTDTYDDDMIGRRWLMTESGLSCQDCPAKKHKNENDDEDDEDWNEHKNSRRINYRTSLLVL
ncbi:MAG: PspC domain-containing protein, partial [Sphingobacteriales bacterium]